MKSFLSLGSLILGLIAWILPFVQFKNSKNINRAVLSFLSISACAISLYFQIYNYNYLVEIGDLAALMDTAGASSFVSAVLLAVTIVLNAINLFIYFNKTAK